MLRSILIWVGVLSCGCSVPHDCIRYVDPFIGTLHEGHCFPGATVPLDMVQPGPESADTLYEGYFMDHVTGYRYADRYLAGFTQTRLNGVGCPSMSDILLMPYCGREIADTRRESYRSTYDKSTEQASPGYYAVWLEDNRTHVELTATSRVACHRYRFDDPATARVLIDLQYGVAWDSTRLSGNVLAARQEFDEYGLSGYRRPREWAPRDQYYTIRFDHRIASVVELPPTDSAERAPRYVLGFEMDGDAELGVRIAFSTTGIEAARHNLETEISDGATFESIRRQARKRWNDLLSRVEVSGDEGLKTSFYTALYRLYMQPNDIADSDGKYRSESGEVRMSRSGHFYSTLSLWDTYRAAHPFYTLLTPSLVPLFNGSIMEHYAAKVADPANPLEANPYLPRWALWGHETHTMIGNHAVPVLVDGWLKGLRPAGYDDGELFEAVWTSLRKGHYRNHTELIDRYGYIPCDVSLSAVDDGRETVSRLLESTYDDHCAALLARALGRCGEADTLEALSRNWMKVYDPVSGFMCGRRADGTFRRGNDPARVVGEWVAGSDFTEGNAWHYLFHVQHDIEGLMEQMGGEQAFVARLDSMFYTRTGRPYVKDLVWNIYGTLGQYWHGNEPCHHVPYLYKYTSCGYKTDAILRYLTRRFYVVAPDGLRGNDDCGQMSAWYLFAVSGFYPVDPCGGEFVLGAPQAERVVFRLENGKTFTVRAEGLSEECMFVRSVTLDGKPFVGRTISYDRIMEGGELVFHMGSRPDHVELLNFCCG